MATALITHLDCLGHETPVHVNEQPARLRRILDALDDLDLVRLPARRATDADIARCHPQTYIDRVFGQLPLTGHACLDEGRGDETYLSPASGPALRRAVGGPLQGVDAVLDGAVVNAFVAVRPPGHHAETERPMGFCAFGNVAIAAKYALDHHGLDRVGVLDFDVHHGNGTQALLQDDPRALVVTSQQMPLWPGTGAADDRGTHGTVLNLPLAPATDGRHAIDVWQRQAVPALRAHRPDMVLISAGFDAHQDDPLAQLMWSTGDFADLTKLIAQEAGQLCRGRVVSVLEGGYDLDALAASARAHVSELIKAGQ